MDYIENVTLNRFEDGIDLTMDSLYQNAMVLLNWFGYQFSLVSTTTVASFFAGLVVFSFLEWCYPFIQLPPKATIRAYYHNVTIFLFNDLVMSLLSITSLFLIAEQFTNNGLIENRHYSVAESFLIFIAVDFSIFLWHIANHKIPWLWMFHKVHHSDKTLNVSTALRFHVGELILTVVFKCALIIAFGISEKVIIATQVLITWFTIFHHSNISFKQEKYLSKIIMVPSLHRMHHSSKRIEHDSNYGGVFSFWDRLLGTLKEGVPATIGLQAVNELSVWESLKFGCSAYYPTQALQQPVSIPEGCNTTNLDQTDQVPDPEPISYVKNDPIPANPILRPAELVFEMYFSYLQLNIALLKNAIDITQNKIATPNDTFMSFNKTLVQTPQATRFVQPSVLSAPAKGIY